LARAEADCAIVIVSLPAFTQVRGLMAANKMEPVSGFEPLTVRLQGRFETGGLLLRSWREPVSSSSWCRSMAAVSVSFWHATGTLGLIPATSRGCSPKHPPARLLSRRQRSPPGSSGEEGEEDEDVPRSYP
jgi:hypothetical protein